MKIKAVRKISISIKNNKLGYPNLYKNSPVKIQIIWV